MNILQVKLFYKSQRELAVALNEIVDAYWHDEVDNDDFIESIQNLYINNPNKVLKEGEFTTVLKQQCGKRRLEVIERILMNDNKITIESSVN
ncbi:TIGR04540 family protein [Rossellomorea oryzaecorticis]|uniref:TIGR04540 family protein n=1 Tax=Rossellomorea oryzaecorticis TaxID=1396505 RepID=A0ABU9K6Q0_9BACI